MEDSKLISKDDIPRYQNQKNSRERFARRDNPSAPASNATNAADAQKSAVVEVLTQLGIEIPKKEEPQSELQATVTATLKSLGYKVDEKQETT